MTKLRCDIKDRDQFRNLPQKKKFIHLRIPPKLPRTLGVIVTPQV